MRIPALSSLAEAISGDEREMISAVPITDPFHCRAKRRIVWKLPRRWLQMTDSEAVLTENTPYVSL